MAVFKIIGYETCLYATELASSERAPARTATAQVEFLFMKMRTRMTNKAVVGSGLARMICSLWWCFGSRRRKCSGKR